MQDLRKAKSKDQRKEQPSAVMQRLNITSAFRRTVSGHGTDTLLCPVTPLTVCAWRCSKWSSEVFSLFMTPLIRSKSYQSVKNSFGPFSFLTVYIHTPTHTYIYIYVLTYQGTWGQSQKFSPFFLTY